MVLKDDGPVRSRLVNLLVFEDDPAVGCFDQAGDDVEEGRLAAAGVADDGDELAFGHAQTDLAQDLAMDRPAAEGDTQLFDREVGMHGAPSTLPRATR